MVRYLLWALFSLNERACGREPVELPEPSEEWVGDCLLALTVEAEALEESLAEFRGKTHGEEWE